MKLEELILFVKSAKNLESALQESLLLFLQDSRSIDFQSTAPMYIALSKERDLELYLKIDPVFKNWRVFASLPAKAAATTTAPGTISASASLPPAPSKQTPPSNENHAQPLDYQSLVFEAEEIYRAVGKSIFPPEAELEQTFRFYISNLAPRFRQSFPDMPEEDITQLISLRWKTLPMAEQLLYFQALMASQ